MKWPEALMQTPDTPKMSPEAPRETPDMSKKSPDALMESPDGNMDTLETERVTSKRNSSGACRTPCEETPTQGWFHRPARWPVTIHHF